MLSLVTATRSIAKMYLLPVWQFNVVYNVHRYVCCIQYITRRYKLIGTAIQRCTAKGQWSEDMPLCIPINCSIPEPIANGRVDYDNITYGSNITFSCKQGYVEMTLYSSL